jgi:hypothetical protein
MMRSMTPLSGSSFLPFSLTRELKRSIILLQG